MTRRSEQDAVERRRARVYETALAAAVALMCAGLLGAFGLVLYAAVLSPRAPAPQVILPVHEAPSAGN